MNTEMETPKHKQLTSFLCQELLYEHVTGALDPAKQLAVDDHISGCHESQRELQKLKAGVHYCQVAQTVSISKELSEALINFEPQWKKRFREWSVWSSERGWRALPYLFVAISLALGLYITKPWNKEIHREVILAEQLRKEPDMLPPNSPELEALAGHVAKPKQTPETEKLNTPAPTIVVEAETKPSEAEPQTPPTQPKDKAPVVAVNNPKPVTTAIDEEGKIHNHEPKGYIFRGVIQVSDFSNTWPVVREKIVALGGRVAGNVELGWLRKPTQSYFHFVLPEKNQAELELFLSTFGQVRFNRERHPRVMPEGEVRIILTVKDGATNEATAEAP